MAAMSPEAKAKMLATRAANKARKAAEEKAAESPATMTESPESTATNDRDLDGWTNIILGQSTGTTEATRNAAAIAGALNAPIVHLDGTVTTLAESNPAKAAEIAAKLDEKEAAKKERETKKREFLETLEESVRVGIWDNVQQSRLNMGKAWTAFNHLKHLKVVSDGKGGWIESDNPKRGEFVYKVRGFKTWAAYVTEFLFPGASAELTKAMKIAEHDDLLEAWIGYVDTTTGIPCDSPISTLAAQTIAQLWKEEDEKPEREFVVDAIRKLPRYGQDAFFTLARRYEEGRAKASGGHDVDTLKERFATHESELVQIKTADQLRAWRKQYPEYDAPTKQTEPAEPEPETLAQRHERLTLREQELTTQIAALQAELSMVQSELREVASITARAGSMTA